MTGARAMASMARIIRVAVAGRHPRRTALRAALIALVASLVFGRVWRPAWVAGESMAPTVPDRSFRFVALLRYARRDPQPGDIVAVRMAGRRVMYLKRVLATGGDRIAFSNGVLRVNGVVRPEPYVQFHGDWTFAETTLAADEFFVAGDNRALPPPAHVAGAVRRDRIAGGLLY